MKHRSIIFHGLMVWLGLSLRSGAAAPANPAGSDPAQGTPPIPWNELGAKATAQYSGDGLAVNTTAGGARLRCAFQKLEGGVTPQGLWVSSTESGSSDTPFLMLATSLGRERGVRRTLPATGTVETTVPVARFIRPGLVEEYRVSVDGLRQDFVLPERLPGEGTLRVELNVAGATTEASPDGVRLVLKSSGRKLNYHRLRATDATGRELAARMEVVSPTQLAVMVEDGGAVYPVRIDPTFSDANWTSIGGLPGANGAVYAAVVDGSGNLYIGGKFTMVGGVAANHVAKWDGNSWSALGPGIIDGYVWALVVLGGELYAGGDFLSAGGNAASWLTRWNGSSWSAVGSGVDGPVDALAVSGSDLYAGGYFTTAGGSAASHVAKWNGSSWSALGSGMNQSVYALAVSGSNLYAGGLFTTAGGSAAIGVAKWNGSSWSALGSVRNGEVWTLAVSGSDLYAGGEFTTGAGGAGNHIAKWNGSSWSPLGSGMNNSVFALTVSGSDLYAGGWFTTAGGSEANYIAKWNGSSWSALGSGMNDRVKVLVVSGNDLYAGGDFWAAGGKTSLRLARANFCSTPPLPSLSIRLTDPNTVRISWPSPSTGFVLQQNTSGLSPAGWSNVTGTIQDDGSNRILIVNPTAPRGFYRLIRP